MPLARVERIQVSPVVFPQLDGRRVHGIRQEGWPLIRTQKCLFAPFTLHNSPGKRKPCTRFFRAGGAGGLSPRVLRFAAERTASYDDTIMTRWRWISLLVVLLTLALGWLLVHWVGGGPGTQAAGYVGRRDCAGCHEKETALWTGSDHDRAMDFATPETVLGQFDGREATHFDSRARMFRRGEQFLVTTDNRQGRPETFTVKYVFGVRPLQQYLVEFPDGRVQCLPWAWDTEEKRWFHLYPDEPIPHDDELHWTGPLQNWNYMCAECHSTNLEKNYDLASNTYRTTFSEIDVSCETCHGPGSLHSQWAGAEDSPSEHGPGFGLAPLASADPRVEIETCAPCHSRRRVIYPGFQAGDKFLDHYVPELLDTDRYFPDGQILDEDYEYGSFLQSRMYRKKVRCSNCHDPHSMKVKYPDNRLCGQCHLPTKYDTPRHHFHPDASKPGTLCVDCHMCQRTYMVVDPRRDHSLRVPRPDLSVDLGVPNACTGCHHDASKGESDAWAAQQVRQWYGPRKDPRHFAYAIAAGRQGLPEGEPMLGRLLRRADLSAVVRASALVLLARYGTLDAQTVLCENLDSPEALVRMAAVRGLESAAPSVLAARVVPLVHDSVRAVRIEAARVVSTLPPDQMRRRDREAFDAALREYVEGQNALGDQAAAHLSLGVIHENQGRREQAEQAYKTALRLDEAFLPARMNLAMLMNSMGRNAEAETQLRRAVELAPQLADVHYSLGLLLAEDQRRLGEAAEALARAAKLAPDSARIHYNLGLALQKLGRGEEAEKALLEAQRLAPRRPEYLTALVILYLQEKQGTKALAAAESLLELAPHDPTAHRLLHDAQEAADRDAAR